MQVSDCSTHGPWGEYGKDKLEGTYVGNMQKYIAWRGSNPRYVIYVKLVHKGLIILLAILLIKS
ncbi:hypothetical protein C3745_07425 [Lactobacillus gasseri]|uniref:Uncharacterized protein n=1 Tax=Lactobacillus gasseri TaxID=1596 RepID=A0AB33CG93_LACGS|nr:hypothetical protein CCE30_09960 [Lactobacillus gasseri]RBQ00741.1 hypothetical protein C3745_07425 [Lactobacillus gasseri]